MIPKSGRERHQNGDAGCGSWYPCMPPHILGRMERRSTLGMKTPGHRAPAHATLLIKRRIATPQEWGSDTAPEGLFSETGGLSEGAPRRMVITIAKTLHVLAAIPQPAPPGREGQCSECACCHGCR